MIAGPLAAVLDTSLIRTRRTRSPLRSQASPHLTRGHPGSASDDLARASDFQHQSRRFSPVRLRFSPSSTCFSGGPGVRHPRPSAFRGPLLAVGFALAPSSTATTVMAKFRNGVTRVLLATDAAGARHPCVTLVGSPSLHDSRVSDPHLATLGSAVRRLLRQAARFQKSRLVRARRGAGYHSRSKSDTVTGWPS
jgi:hypothetical protein